MKIFNHKPATIVISGIIAFILLFYVIMPFKDMIKYRHRIVNDDYKHFLWLINDSLKLDNTFGHDTLFSVSGNVRASDALFNYNMEDRSFINIWEFKDLGQINFKQINLNNSLTISPPEKKSIEVINEDVNNFPTIYIKYKLPFNQQLQIDFDDRSEYERVLDTGNCIALFGKFNKMSLKNGEGDQLVYLDFTKAKQEYIILYKIESRFFLIFITSEHPFDQSAIKLLNLKFVN